MKETYLNLNFSGVPANFLLLDNISNPTLNAAIPDKFPVQGSETENAGNLINERIRRTLYLYAK